MPQDQPTPRSLLARIGRMATGGEAADQPFIGGVRMRIFLLSFTLLFFELLCIR